MAGKLVEGENEFVQEGRGRKTEVAVLLVCLLELLLLCKEGTYANKPGEHPEPRSSVTKRH